MSKDIKLDDLDLESGSPRRAGRTVGFAPDIENPYSSGESDGETGEYYGPGKGKGGYAYVEGGDLSTSSTTLPTSQQQPENEGLDLKGKGKGKGKSKRRRRSSGSAAGPRHSNRRMARPQQPRLIRMAMIIIVPMILLLGMFFLVSMASSNESKNASPVVAPTGFSYPSGFDITNNWGSLSPYFDSGSPLGSMPAERQVGSAIKGIPQQCSLDQVHVLHRHAERYPTPGIGGKMEAFAAKVKKMKEPPAKVFSWLDSWEYKLKQQLLVASGVGTEFQSGADFWESHGQQLFNSTEQGYLLYHPSLNVDVNGTAKARPVFRATTQSRIQTSARAWAAGFFGLYGDDPARETPLDTSKLYDLVLQEEEDGMNSTLGGYFGCPNAYNDSYTPAANLTQQWINTYLAETTIRLQKLLPGFHNMTANDVFYMQNLCAFEHAAYGSSPWCGLFTETEWRGFEYSSDLDFYGFNGHGSAVGAAEGAGWIYELLARLEKRYITEPKYGVNVSLTNAENVFPLNQTLYLDMTHDSVIISVLTALGLDFLKERLPATKIPVPRQFIISRLTPFGARMYVEVMTCNNGAKSVDKYVRLKLNNRVVPLSSLKNCPEDKAGLCPFDKFVKSLHYALEQIDYDTACYGAPKNWALNAE